MVVQGMEESVVEAKRGGGEHCRNKTAEELEGGSASLCRGGRGVEHYRERGEGSTEYRRKRRRIMLLQRRSRWRKRNLQRRLCSAVFESGIESRLLGLTEKIGRGRDGEKGKRESEMLTHISITMWCQWSVCEASCCLVTVLQQQRQCLCLYVSSSQWWVSARLSHCCRHVCCLETTVY